MRRYDIEYTIHDIVRLTHILLRWTSGEKKTGARAAVFKKTPRSAKVLKTVVSVLRVEVLASLTSLEKMASILEKGRGNDKLWGATARLKKIPNVQTRISYTSLPDRKARWLVQRQMYVATVFLNWRTVNKGCARQRVGYLVQPCTDIIRKAWNLLHNSVQDLNIILLWLM